MSTGSLDRARPLAERTTASKGRRREHRRSKVIAMLVMLTAVAGSMVLLGFDGRASASPSISPITINNQNWKVATRYGNSYPSVYQEGEDGYDLVLLEGGLTQTNPSGPTARLLGWVGPSYCHRCFAPSHTIYTVVHTLGGTYSDLSIATDGSIWLIPLPSTNFGFVSLEGITYYPSGYSDCSGTPLVLGPCIQNLDLNGNNWVANTQFGSSTPSWFEDSTGTVHLQGGVTQLSSPYVGTADLIGQLPAWVRPGRDVYTIVHSFYGTYAYLDINESGQIWLIPSANTNTGYVSLDGVTFSNAGDVDLFGASYYTGNGINPVSPNAYNWSTNAQYTSAQAGWYKDYNGTVHLLGAVTQINSGGTVPDFIGTLPPAATPNRWVYTIVHTFQGSYADLGIGPNGQIWLFTSPNTNATFVSLEGITYVQNG
jgi:hypothetical protein